MSSQKSTLGVHPDVVESAKRYAAEHGTSVSQLVETFLAAISSGDPSIPADTTSAVAAPAPPILARMRGALREVSVEDHRDHLVAKYG